MVAEHLQFLYSECNGMVQNERKKDLSNMYDLLKSVQNAMVVLVDTVLDHIKTQGLAVSINDFILFRILKNIPIQPYGFIAVTN